MGSKKAGDEAHDRGKLKEINKSKDVNRRAGSSLVSEGVGFSPSDLGKKKKHKSHGTLDNDVEQNDSQKGAVNADRDTRNDEQKKNKKKRKREQSGDDKENQRLGNTNEACENSEVVCQTGEDLQEKKKNKKVKSLKDNDMESEDRETKKKKKEEEVKPPKENGVECEDRKTEKKKKKNKKEWEEEEEVKSLKDNVVELEEGKTEKKKKKRDEEVESLKDNDVELEDRKTEKKKKKKKKRKKKKNEEEEVKSRKGDDVELESKKTEKKKNKEELKDNDVELENRKTEKKKRKKGEEVVPLKENDVESENRKTEKKKKKKKREEVVDPLKENDEELGDRKSEKKKKVKSAKGDSQSTSGASASIAKREDSSNEPKSKRKKKSVSFAEDVVVFPSSDKPDNECKEGDLVRGKRFSPEEDKLLTWAVENYIDEHQLGEEGIKMIMNCRKHPEVKDCWKEIGAALPWRPKESVYYRAHILFERGTDRTWTPEELEHVRKFYEEHGANWKKLAGELGKHRFHVKDAWRRIKLPNQKRGVWSQDEYQKLFDLVNTDLRLRVLEEKKSKHGMLRDNISWGAVSDKLESRSNALCCMKWYNQLSSPMVAEGKWLDTDDYHLLMELYELDACCMEDVEWDNLLEHRSGDVCRKRWTQMVKHLGENKDKSFAEQVEVLIGRYCPDVLEAREAYNKKEAVDS